MSRIQRAMLKCVDAQVVVDQFESAAKSTAATVIPMGIRASDLAVWREEQLNPSNHPEWQHAIERRNALVGNAGMSLEEWLQYWNEARGR